LASSKGCSTDTTTKRVRGSSTEVARVKLISVIEPLLSTIGSGGCGVNNGILLDDPDELLAGVVEAQLDLVGSTSNRFITSELELLNEILVANLGETATLVSVEVDVVNPEGTSGEGSGESSSSVLPRALSKGAELDVDLNLMILEGNQRKSKTRVAAEPELEGDVENSSGHSLSIGDNLNETGHVSNHVGISRLMTSRLGKLVPDVEPVAIVLVNTLATDFELNVLQENVADPVNPTERVSSNGSNERERHLKVNTMNQITIARNGAGNLATEVGGTVECLLNRLHREVGMATVDYLEERNLGIPRKIDILSAIGDKLHKSSTHFIRLSF
jgi:hypothetical protein